jgi:hypothetical protein
VTSSSFALVIAPERHAFLTPVCLFQSSQAVGYPATTRIVKGARDPAIYGSCAGNATLTSAHEPLYGRAPLQEIEMGVMAGSRRRLVFV